MKTCDTCKFFTIAIIGMQCSNPKLAPELQEGDIFVPQDDELFCSISLSISGVSSVSKNVPPSVGPKFGCIHWEAK